jgi:hypothetical protein
VLIRISSDSSPTTSSWAVGSAVFMPRSYQARRTGSVDPAPAAPAGRDHDAADREREAQHENREQQRVASSHRALSADLDMTARAVRTRTRTGLICGAARLLPGRGGRPRRPRRRV